MLPPRGDTVATRGLSGGHMATARITRRLVETIAASSKPLVIYDTELKGFGVRIMPSGVATYIVEYRPGEGGRGVAKKRMALGRTNELTPDEARKLAQQSLGAVRHGDDPLLERETRRREIKVHELIDLWEAENPTGQKSGKPMAARTRTNTLARLRHHVVPLLGDRRVSTLSVEDVNDMIRRITSGETKRTGNSSDKRGRIVVTGGAGAARKVASDLSILYGFAAEKADRRIEPRHGGAQAKGRQAKRLLACRAHRSHQQGSCAN